MSPRRAVVALVLAQFLGTSLWFSVNAVSDGLRADWGLTSVQLGRLTVAVQLGFVLGTLVISVTGLADRFSASRIFVTCALAGAATNLGFAWWSDDAAQGWWWRLGTGLALAGVYPLGMKMVVSWRPDRAQEVLGWLVGMLVLGTAFPQLIRGLGETLPWQVVVSVSSVLAVLAAGLVGWVGDGPHLPRRGVQRLSLTALGPALRVRAYRGAVLGYFGHMWELYAAWTLVPLVIPLLLTTSATQTAWLSFVVIGAGAVGCVVGGRLSRRWGSARVAATALAVSGAVSALLPWTTRWPAVLTLAVLVIWGLALAADSPQFSALSAQACPPQLVGSALAIANSVGFALTMVTIVVTASLVDSVGVAVTWVLVAGPVVGLVAMVRLLGPELRQAVPHEQ